jgi:hypothetical protein
VILLLVSSFGLLESSLRSAQADPEGLWSFVSSDQANYRVDRSLEAQHGVQLAVIDGTELTYPIEYQKNQQQYWQRIFRPSGYIYQTIKAEPYVAKHLHISGFARGVKPNFAEMEKEFSDYHEGDQQARLAEFLGNLNVSDGAEASQRFNEEANAIYQEKRLEFVNFIQRSYENSQYGIAVVLDMGLTQLGKVDIQWHSPTSFGAPSLNELWNRFNVEVSVPEGCKSISIVLWQHGVAITEFDHLVVSEQGDAVGRGRVGYHFGTENLIKKLLENKLETSSFSNLSFE